MIDPESKDELKRVINIVVHVAKSVPLTPKTPSLHFGDSPFSEAGKRKLIVSSDLQTFCCPVSGKSGDVIQWEMETQGIGFSQAAHSLAAQYGFKLKYL